MGRGFLSGIFMGAIVSAILIFVSSQVLERQSLSFPKPSASAVEVPAGTEFDQARAESDPVLPDTETRPGADVVVEAPVPDDAPDAPPALDTSALEVPTPAVEAPQTLETVVVEEDDAPTAPDADSQASLGGVSDLETPEAPGDAPEADTGTPVVTQAPLEDAAPEAGAEDSAPQVETEIAALPQTDVDAGTSETTLTAPAVTSEDAAPSAPMAPEISSEPSLPDVSVADNSSEAGTSDPRVTVIEIIGDQAPTVQDAPSRAPLIEIIEPAREPDDAAGAEQVTPQGDAEEVPSFLRPVEILENAGEVESARLPQVSDADAPAVTPVTPVTPEAAQDANPEQGDASAETRQAALPTIRRPGSETVAVDAGEDDSAPEADESGDDAVARAALPAIEQHAIEFENPEGNPLLSVVLVHSGKMLTQAQLDELPDALAFGIDAGAPDAGEVAKHYRDAGREVVMIPSLPQGARPQDVEQALRVNFETITQAVAVMDVSGGSFQSDRAAVAQVVDVIATSGHGLITFPRGLNTAHQRASRAGVAAGLIFREMDGSGEDAEQIQRTLDRAAFRARQDEAVILVGTTDATTLIAMVEWVVGNRAQSVTLAPISAALMGGG